MNAENRSRLRLSAAAAGVTTAAAFSLVRLVQSGPWLAACLLVIAVVATSGHLARALNAPRALVVIVQIVVTTLIVTVLLTPRPAIALFLPGPAALHALGTQLAAGRGDIARESPPAVATPGLTAILVLFCAGFALLVDFTAVTARRAVLVGLPLLAVYLVPATRRPGGYSWLAFIVCALAYVVLVSADGHDRIERWGRALGGGGTSSATAISAGTGTHSAVARRVASVAVASALVLPWFIPTLPGLFTGVGGSGSGNGSTVIVNSTINLGSSLKSSTAVPLLRYTTNAPDPRDEYLRMSVDDDFDGNSWTASPPSALDPMSGQPQIPGLTTPGIAQTQVKTIVSVVGNLAYQTVPAPYAPTAVDNVAAPTYDPATMVIVAGDSATKSRLGQQYTVYSTDIAPTPAQLAAAPRSTDPSLSPYLELPTTFPTDVSALARTITKGAATPFQEALDLQQYFLANFTYSLSIPAGDGDSAIEQFLKSREGFCQQFAGTMAAMARSLGIPAIVAVGFTPGTPQTDGSYVVTTHDAHAWPMLYFGGVGWVRFEPTPTIATSGRGAEPSWTLSTSGPQSSASASAANPSAAATSGADASKCVGQLRKFTGVCGVSGNAGAAATRQAFAGLGPFGAVPRWFERWFLTGSATQIALKLLVLALFLLSAAPALGRVRRRRSRRSLVKQAERYLARTAADEEKGTAAGEGTGIGDEDGAIPRRGRRQRGGGAAPSLSTVAVAAWDELRECADDFGYPWFDSDTPRQAAARLSASAHLGEDADAALGRVTRFTEQARYAQSAVLDPPALRAIPGDLRSVRTALAERASRSDRFKAAILPSSSLARFRERRDRVAATVYRKTRRR